MKWKTGGKGKGQTHCILGILYIITINILNSSTFFFFFVHTILLGFILCQSATYIV